MDAFLSELINCAKSDLSAIVGKPVFGCSSGLECTLGEKGGRRLGAGRCIREQCSQLHFCPGLVKIRGFAKLTISIQFT